MSEISEVWRDLHNLCAQFASLVELRDLYARAKATEEQAVGQEGRLTLVTTQVNDMDTRLANLQQEYAEVDGRYQQKLKHLEETHAKVTADLDAEYVKRLDTLESDYRRKHQELDAALVESEIKTRAAISAAQDDLLKKRSDAEIEIARLGSDKKAAEEALAVIERAIDARRASLEAIKREAARVAGGG